MRTLSAFFLIWLGATSVQAQVPTAEAAFWGWFGQHRTDLARATADTALQHRLYPEVIQALRQVHPGLTYELARLPDGRAQFIVSADGIKEIFPNVQALVAALPPGGWDGWQISAFRPRIGTSYSITMADFVLAPRDIWFRAAETDEGTVQLQFYVRGFKPDRAAQIRTAVEVLVDAALGEYDARTKLGERDFFPLPIDPRRYGLTPFTELPSMVDRLAKKH